MALTFTESDLDNLKAAYLSGARRVRIGDRDVEYRSQAEILAAIRNIQQYLDGVTTATESSTTIQATFNKGVSE